MFYPELLGMENYDLFSEIINKLDTWFAFLPISEQDKITSSKVSVKFAVDYDIASMLLEKCNELGILDKMYAITCPSCNQILVITKYEYLYDEINELNDCYSCDAEDITISEDNVFATYKLNHSPTLPPGTLKKEITNAINISNHYSNKETLSELFKQNKENPSEMFYKVDQSTKVTLIDLYNNLDKHYETTTEKGSILEDIALILLRTVKGFRATKIIRTPTNQIDCTVSNKLCFGPPVFRELGTFFIVECKNEKGIPGNTYYHKLIGVLNSLRKPEDNEVNLAILFSIEDVARTCNIIARENFLKHGIFVVNICKKDLKKIIIDEGNFLDLIWLKISNIRTNSKKEKLEESELFMDIII